MRPAAEIRQGRRQFAQQRLEPLLPGRVRARAAHRIRRTEKFNSPDVRGEIQVTVDLKAVSCGTELVPCLA
jgi:hypothetical protein